jgi:hypothetical protein
MYQGSCSCGKVKIGVDIDPFLNYKCHCSHCRSFASRGSTKALYHSGGAVWRWNAYLDDEENVMEYDETRALGGLFAMSRGRCSNCKDPIIENCHRLVAPFVMVPTNTLVGLSHPDTNIFYNSGLKQGTHGLRTIYTDFGSLMYEIWIILIVAIPSIPKSIIARLRRVRNNPTVKIQQKKDK